MKMTLASLWVLALALVISPTQAALMFDIDGPGAAFTADEVQGFDWLPVEALTVGGGEAQPGDPITLLYQAELSEVIFTNQTQSIPVGAAGPYEITIEAEIEGEVFNRIDLTGDGFDNQRLLSFDSGTLRIYYDDLSGGALSNANNLTTNLGNTNGAFTNGTLILEGSVNPRLLGASFIFQDGTTVIDLDRFGVDDLPLVDTLIGEGNATVEADVTGFNPLWWPGTMVPTVVLNVTTQETPFDNNNPSTNVLGVMPDYGANNINGLGFPGSDFHVEADANMSFESVQIPEPHLALLLAMGLLGVGAVGWRRRR